MEVKKLLMIFQVYVRKKGEISNMRRGVCIRRYVRPFFVFHILSEEDW